MTDRPLFYWREAVRNFGDRLSPDLLYWRYGVNAKWAPMRDAPLQMIGSIIQETPCDWGGIVFGAGLIKKQMHTLPNADIRVLRGKLTAERLGVTAPLYGDPGLLAPALVAGYGSLAHSCASVIGIIPHYADTTLLDITGHNDGQANTMHIPITMSGPDLIWAAASCTEIHTSSLHGLILADALGIPRRWYPNPNVIGNGFKFQDYASAFGETIVPGVLHSPPRDKIRSLQADLKEALDEVIIKELKWAEKVQ